MVSPDSWRSKLHLPRGILSDELNWLSQGIDLVHLLCMSPSLHDWRAGHWCMTTKGHPNDYHCTQAIGLTDPGLPRQSTSSHWDCTSSCASPAWYPLCWHYTCWVPICWIHCQPHAEKSGTTLPVAHLVISATSGPMLTPIRLRLGVSTALYRARTTCLNWHQRLGQAPNQNGSNLPVCLPVQQSPPLILTTVKWGEHLGVPGIKTLRAAPTTVRPHLTWMHPEKMWLTLIWSQLLEIVSHAQTQIR